MKKSLSFILTPIFILALSVCIQAQEYGMASYYSDDYQGRKTAYGDVYNKSELTAAHKKHPYGTILKVTRLDNKKYVTVKVTDKGPYIKGRVVELSRKAAEKIGLIKDGLAEVKVEVVKRMERDSDTKSTASTTSSKTKTNSSKSASSSSKSSSTKSTKKETTPSSYENKSRVASSKSTSKKSTEKETSKSGSSKSKSKTAKARLVKQDYQKYGLYEIELRRPEKKGYGVQVASLTTYENVLKQVADLQAKWFDNILISVEPGDTKPLYKIILGPLDTEKSAINYKSSLKKKHKINGFVVDLNELNN
jgi:rare lipoprotein A